MQIDFKYWSITGWWLIFSGVLTVWIQAGPRRCLAVWWPSELLCQDTTQRPARPATLAARWALLPILVVAALLSIRPGLRRRSCISKLHSASRREWQRLSEEGLQRRTSWPCLNLYSKAWTLLTAVVASQGRRHVAGACMKAEQFPVCHQHL